METKEYNPTENHVINSPLIFTMAPLPLPVSCANKTVSNENINEINNHILYFLLFSIRAKILVTNKVTPQ